MNNTKEKGSKLFLSLVIIIMLLSTISILLVITTPMVKAAVPTVSSAKISGGNQFTIVFSEGVTAAADDFSDLKINSLARNVLDRTGSGTDTIVVTFDGTAVGTDATGTVDLETDIVNGADEHLAFVNNRPLLDGQASTVVITAPVVGTHVKGTATFTFTSSEAGTQECNIDGGAWESCASGDAFSTLSDFAALGEGAFTLNVRDIDAAGNIGTASRSFVKDTIAPTVAITAPLTGIKVKASYAVTFTDDEITAAQCSINDVAWVACTTGVTTLHDITGFDALGQGAFTLYLRDTDAAGNVGTDSEAGIIKETVAPSLLYAVLDADHNGNQYTYIDVHFSENVVNTTIATTDFAIGNASATVSAFYNDGNTALVTLKLSSKLTGNGPTISVVGAINDSAGNTLSSAGPITINTYRVNLNEGWNMFSIPADVSDISIPTLLSSIWSNINKTTNILWYNASANTWKYYSAQSSSGTITAFQPGRAYWIKMNASDTLIGNYSTVWNNLGPAPIVELTGHRWNMIGHWATYNQTGNTTGGLRTLSHVLAENGELLYKYTPSGGFVNVYGSSTVKMQPGDGFWLYLRTADNGYYTSAES